MSARLSCERCTRRRIKCDKGDPCSSCKTAGIACDVVSRARLPRGRSGKGSRRKKALEGRLERLEGLVKQLDAVQTQVLNGNGSSDLDQTTDVSPAEQAQRPVGKLSGLVARDFWLAICQEVSGLRGTLEDSESEEAHEEPNSKPAVQPNYGSVSILFDQATQTTDTANLQPPPQSTRSMLFRIYQARVDKIVKLLHLRTVIDMIEKNHANANQIPALRALEFAIYFMSICSMTDDEAITMMSGDKSSLIQQYRHATEVAISRADLYQNPDLAVLQAFVIYLTGMRTCRKIEAMWVLTAVAARVAIALGLGPDDSTNWPPYDLENRRRLWFGIGVLDTNAALERGSVPLLRWEDFQSPPSNINDSDISPTPIPRPPALVCCSSDMSFSSMAYEAMVCQKKICSSSFESLDEWNHKILIISDFEESMKRQYSWIDESATPFERFTRSMAEAFALHMQLLLRRPPYRDKHNRVPPWDHFDLMEVTTLLLERSLQKQAEDIYAPWAWITHSKWYVLAILLVELCSSKSVESSDRAYAVARASFDQYAPLMSDTDSGIFWRPIARLMRRVQKSRGNPILEGDNHQSMADGNVQLASSAPSKQNNGMAASTLGCQSIVASSQVAPVIPTSTSPEPTNGFASDPKPNPETDDGMAWINWDFFLADLGSSSANIV